jgi:redox-sensitive bicupin YhaK (pirin superfamily)
MKKKIEFISGGHPANIGEMLISRIIPNNKTQAVGPFVFLDYVSPIHYVARTPQMPDGRGAHPHRGIATFTYLLHGEFEHFDSRGHHGIVNDGGGQWMNAGNGIIHDENFSQAFQKSGGALLGMQFWINLPSGIKKALPDYMPVQDNEFPKVLMPDDAGIFKIVIGTYEGKTSKIKTFTEQFLYHLQLKPGKSFEMETKTGWEYAAFAANGGAEINDTYLPEGNLLVFSNKGSAIHFENHTGTTVDIILFGGEPYDEPIISRGPFVMNTDAEITEAFNDYNAGKYGKVDHSKVQTI